MPYVSGTFNIVYNFTNDAASGIPAQPGRFDANFSDIASALTTLNLTSLPSSPANGAIPIGNGAGYTIANITAGTGITVTNTAGGISIASSASGGTVTSVNVSGGSTGLTYSGGPVSSAGTITLAGTLNIANGGTGATVASTARANLGAAGSGTNSDITGLITGVSLTESGTISASTLGFRGLPQNSQGGSYTLALTDAGKHVYISTGGITIPANASIAFPVGTPIVLVNASASTQSIAITTDTLTLAGGTSTGTRTLAANGIASLLKVTSTAWLISGNVT